MQPRTAPKVHPAPMVLDESESSPSIEPVRVPKILTISMAVSAFMVLVAVAMVILTVRLQQKVMSTQQEVSRQAAAFVAEMEQLRTDVLTTSSENNVYLKIMLLKPGIDKELARDIAHSVVIRAREHKRDPDLVLAIIDVESNFNPNAVSHMGAVGLMQIMPMWKKSFGIELDLRHIDTSVNYGLKILGAYEQTFGGLEMALTAYNRGPNLVALDMRQGRVPFNGYAENIMRTYSRIKSWTRP